MKFTKALFTLAVIPGVVLATSNRNGGRNSGSSGTLVGSDAPAHCECESLMASVCPNNNFQFPNQFENTLQGLTDKCTGEFCPNNAKDLNCDKDDSCQCMANSADIPNGPGDKSDCNGERTCNCGSGDVGYSGDQDGGHCTSGPNTCNFNTGLIGTDNGDNNVCNHREACNCNDGQIQDKSCDGEQSCNYNSGYIGTTNLDNTVCNGFKSCNYNCGRYRVCPGDEDRNLPGELGMGVITGYCNGERSCNGNQGVIRGISTCNSEGSCNCNQGYISGGCNGKNTCNAVPYCIEIKGGCEDENSCNFIGATDSCCESESAAASCISDYCDGGNCEYVDCPDPSASSTAYKELNEQCQVTAQGNKYVDVAGWTCNPNSATNGELHCASVEDDGTTNGPFYGTCTLAKCSGKATSSGNGNGNGNNNDGTSDNATDRVTICHRTCSPKNPWVRITIDKDAWGNTYNGTEANGTSGCGHQLQHNVTEDCNRDDYSPWEPWLADYLIKDHGKKAWYSSDYWSYWEPACPSVHNDKTNGGKACCDPSRSDHITTWPDGTQRASCCGMAVPAEEEVVTPAPVSPRPTPNPTPTPTPNPTPNPTPGPTPAPVFGDASISVQKTVTKSTRSCTGFEELAGAVGDAFKYCYEITNTGLVSLCSLTLSDTASASGYSTASINGGMARGCLGVGDSVMVEGPVFSNPEGGETTDATATGSPSDGGHGVRDADDATVSVVAIGLVKTVGKTCGSSSDLYVGIAGETAEYCYAISNLGTTPICAIALTDPNLAEGAYAIGDGAGGSGRAITGSPMTNGCLPVGGTVNVINPFPVPEGGEEETATVVGLPEGQTEPTVTASCNAEVQEASISVGKTPLPDGRSCSVTTTGDDTLVGEIGDDAFYCYVIENTGSSPVCGLSLDDSSSVSTFQSSLTLGGDMSNGCLPPGGKVAVPGRKFRIPRAGEFTVVTCYGTPPSGPRITDTKTGGVASVAIILDKTVGEDCSRSSSDLYVGTVGQDLEYCYKITNDGSLTLCSLALVDTKPSGDFSIGDGAGGSGSAITGGDMSNGCLPPGGVVTVVHDFDLPSGGENEDATVTALPEGLRAPTVTDSDGAHVVEAGITLVKTVADGYDGADSCSVSPGDDSKSGPVGALFKYCYTITNSGPSPICDLVLDDTTSVTDFSISGIDISPIADGCLAPGASVVVEGPSFPNPRTGEDTTVIATANPQPSGDPVSCTDKAPVTPVTASITVEKTVKNVADGSCSVTSHGTDSLTGPVGADFKYCYIIRNPGPVTICSVVLSDPSAAAFMENVAVNGDATGTVDGTESTTCLGPDEFVVVDGADFENPPTGETSTATVTGSPVPSGPTVSDSDDASVGPVTPAIFVEKKAKDATAGSCSEESLGVENFFGPAGSSVKYCYLVENTGPVTLCSVVLSDPSAVAFMENVAVNGDTSGTVDGTASGTCLGPGEKVVVEGAEFSNPEEAEKTTATATGSPEPSGPTVSDSDDASVGPVTPAISVEKKVKNVADGSCSEESLGVESLTGPVGADFKYCYLVKNIGPVTLCSVVMSDPSAAAFMDGVAVNGETSGTVDGTTSGTCLGPDEVVVVDGADFENPAGGEDTTATVTGYPEPSGPSVSDSDNASVAPVTASISIVKNVKPGAESCSVTDSPSPSLAGPVGESFRYCYIITNTGDSTLCSVVMNDPSAAAFMGETPVEGSTTGTVDGVTSNTCVGPDESVVVSGTPFSNPANGDSTFASTTGYPEPSGPSVSDSDDASVSAEEGVSTPMPIAPRTTPGPTPAPADSGCTDMPTDSTGATKCPGDVNIVKPLFSTEDAGEYIYDIAFSASPEGDPLVSFKLINPLDTSADMYVEYHEEVAGAAGSFEPVCVKDTLVPGCDPFASTVTAACVDPEGKTPFSVFTVYFVGTDAALGSGGAEVPECCYEETSGREGFVVASYTYELYCACPAS